MDNICDKSICEHTFSNALSKFSSEYMLCTIHSIFQVIWVCSCSMLHRSVIWRYLLSISLLKKTTFCTSLHVERCKIKWFEVPYSVMIHKLFELDQTVEVQAVNMWWQSMQRVDDGQENPCGFSFCLSSLSPVYCIIVLHVLTLFVHTLFSFFSA